MKKLNDTLIHVIPGLGFELVDCEISPGRLITIYIDKPGGVTIEDCECVSRHLANLFIIENVEYNRLEVSSPGLERPLKKLDDFVRFCGRAIKIKTKESLDDQKVFQGTIREVKGNEIYLELVDNKKLVIAFDNIYKAKLLFELQKRSQIRKKQNHFRNT